MVLENDLLHVQYNFTYKILNQTQILYLFSFHGHPQKKKNNCDVNETSYLTEICYTDCYAHLNFMFSVTVYKTPWQKKSTTIKGKKSINCTLQPKIN